MTLATLFHLLCAQHVSDINIPIFRSLRLKMGGNSSTQSQAPEDGYINVRNMLST